MILSLHEMFPWYLLIFLKRTLVFPTLFFFHFFAIITEKGFFISPCSSLELCIQVGISFLFSFAFHFFSWLLVRLLQTIILPFRISFSWGWSSEELLKPPISENVNYLIQFFIPETGHSLMTSRTIETHQETTWSQIKRGPVHTLLLSAISPLNSCHKKLLTISSSVGTHSFQGQEPVVTPLRDEAIKLFLSASPKTLCLRFHSASVHGGQVFDIKRKKGINLQVLNVKA